MQDPDLLSCVSIHCNTVGFLVAEARSAFPRGSLSNSVAAPEMSKNITKRPPGV